MKKIIVVALAILLAMSTMPLTAFAASEPAKFDFAGFDVKKDSEGKGVVVDLNNMVVYGLSTLLKVKDLGTYLEKGAEVDSMYVCANYGTADQKILGDEDFIGTGTYIVLVDEGVEYPFEFVVFGDVNGDSAVDALDAAYIAKVANNVAAAPTDVATNMAATSPETYEAGITVETYQAVVNNVTMADADIDQNKGENANTVESIVIEDQVYTGETITVEDDVEIIFNESLLSDAHYEIVGYERNIDQTTGEEKATVTLKGKGLFAGEIVVEFEIVGLIQSIVNEVNEVITAANLNNIVEVVYTNNADVDGVDIVINASNAIRGNFDVNMAAFNGLLAKIDEYRAEKLQGVNLTVGDYALASNGAFSRGDVKEFVFDLANGIFCELAYAESNTIKSYTGEIATTAENVEKFNVNLMVKEDVAGDINRIKNFSAKIARYVSFDVVDGNAVINVTMPAAFSTKVVDILGAGDVDAAAAEFNDMLVYHALANYLAKVSADDISAGAASEINQAIEVAAMLGDFVNKALSEVENATVTSNVATMPLLSGNTFNLDKTASNQFGALVVAFANMLSEDVLTSSVGDYYNNGIYTVAADVELEYKGIKETIIVNLDLFGAAETPSVIEETAEYFSGIIADLGLSNSVAVSYDKDNCRALATLDAREFVTNFTLDETAFDGLYTDIKGYFDDNYGTSTIVVDGKEIVSAGAINKSALKELIFSAATGFFQDAANLGANNVLRSLNTVVTEADGTVHNFDLDFALVGSDADIARVASIADKVADYVSFEVVDGNAVVNVGIPAGMRAKIISLLGQGDAAAAQETFNNLMVYNALTGYVANVQPSDISAANADEIQAIVDMVAKVDSIINKVIGKVESGVAYDANGNAYTLLSGEEFVIADNTVKSVVNAFAGQLSEGILLSSIGDFMNEDGVYTVKCDVALSIGGIKETVIINLDVFGDYEKKSAIEDTVDYAESILADLGVSSFASVELKDGKAVATFDASALLADGLASFNEAALDGLYTDVKDYFYANFGDSTITVGDYELVTAGKINKPAVKDVIFDFATGFFTNVANMDSNTFKSYNTVVVDAEGNVEEFAFDFNLSGKEAHIEKLQTIAAKAAELVSFSEVNGNAAVTVSLPAGMKNTVAKYITQDEFNELNVYNALMGYVANVDAKDVSVTYANDIQTAIDMIADMDSVINKVIGKVENAVAYDANGNAYTLLSGEKFAIADASIRGLVTAFASQLSEDLLLSNIGDFMNADGSYTVTCDFTVKGIKESVTVTIDLF